jgi:hypothetical protein
VSGFLCAVALAVTALYLSRRAENRRAARLARERRDLAARVRPAAEPGPQDAAPPGHPGHHGGIKHVPYDDTEEN